MDDYMTDWRQLFSAAALENGERMFLQGKAKKPDEDEYGFSAVVRDERNHRVSVLDEGEGIIGLRCDCGEATDRSPCAHMAAALFLLEDVYDYWTFYINPAYAASLGIGAPGPVPPPPGTAGRGTAGATAGRIASVYRETLGLFDGLQREDAEARTREAGEREMGGELEAYRYFDVAQFRRELRITPKMEREARALFERGELGKTEYRLSDDPGYIDYGKEIATDPEEILDQSFGQRYLHITQHSRSGRWTVEQRYSWNRLLFSRCRSWECFVSKSDNSRLGHSLCVHEVAAFMAVEGYLSNNDLGDATSQVAEHFIRQFAGRGGAEELREGAALLKMAPQVRIDEYGNWKVQFQIGEKRLYKVKNLQELLRDMDRHATVQQGKSTSVTLGREYLDEESLRWLRFVEHSVRTLKLLAGDAGDRETQAYYYDRNGGWEPLTDRIPLTGEILDLFAETLGASPVECERSAWYRHYGSRIEKKKYELRIRDGRLRAELKLEPYFRKENGRFEGVRLSGKLPRVLYGSANAYYPEEDALLRIPAADAEALEPLYSSRNISGEIYLQIGRSNLSAFYRKVLPELRKHAEIEETDPSIPDRYLPEEPYFISYLDVDEDCVLCRPAVYYGAKEHSLLDVYAWRNRLRGPEHYRDGEAEEALIDLLEQYFPEHDEESGLFLTERGEEILYAFLESGITELLRLSEIRATDRFMRLKLRKSVPVEAGVSVESGLMNLTVTSPDVDPDELLAIFEGHRKKKRYVRLKNGDFLRLEENEEIGRLVELMQTLGISPKEFAKGNMRVPLFRALYLDLMLEEIGDVYAERDSHFKKLVKEFKTISDADYDVPLHLKNVLRKYQATGYRWMRTLDEYHFGGILADEMGLGKTVQAIAVMLADHSEIVVGEEDAPSMSLVVCPASLLYNWEEELHRFAPSLRVRTIAGNADERHLLLATAEEEDVDVLITSYDLLKRDIAEYEDMTFRFEWIDEAQYIKNHQTAAAKSVKLIRARTRFALTGTPIENRLSELWSVFDYLMPGFLYDYGSFRKNFEQPIVKYQDAGAMERLRKMVAPFILRRTKKEVLKDLPDKLEEIRYAGFGEGSRQQKLYDAQVVRMREDLRKQTDEDFAKSRIEILAELMRIRQICCDPSLCFEEYSGDSVKREACLELIASAIDGEHKVLVFSQFTSMLSLLEEDLRREEIPYYIITGATPKEKRVQMANAFNGDSTPVFLISLKAGGTGLNLTGADVVIHYDPWWNAAVQNQATDRAHRIGQTKVVNVYQLILRNTIEERIVEMQQKKRALAEDILSQEAIGSAAISREELLELLT